MTNFVLTKSLLAGDTDGYFGHEDLAEGQVVYGYGGPTYGCVSYDGVAVTLVEGQTPFFEVPRTAVERLG